MLGKFTEVVNPAVTLVNLSGDLDESWAAGVHDASDKWTGVLHTDLADVKVTLQSNENSYVVLIFGTHAVEIARGIQNGLSPSESLLQWQEEAEELMTLVEQHEKRLVLLEYHSSPQHPRDLFEHIETELAGAHLALDVSKVPSVKWDAEPIDPVHLLAAMALVIATPPAQSLAERLQALSYPLGKTTSPLELISQACITRNEARRRLANASEVNKNQAARIDALLQENAAVVKQLHSTQEEAELLNASRALLEEKTERLRVGVAKRERKITALRKSRKLHYERTQALKKQLEAFQSDSGSQTSVPTPDVTTPTGEQVTELLKRNRDLERELSRLKSSRSWKYTRVLRKINGTES